jgi:hypothetical protein
MQIFKKNEQILKTKHHTNPIASKHFNYKHVLRDFNIDDFKSIPPYCTCASFPFIYNPTGHVITGVALKSGFDPTFGSLKIDAKRVFIDPLSCFLNYNLY